MNRLRRPDPATTFRFLAERVSELGSHVGVTIRPFHDPELPHLRALPAADQLLIAMGGLQSELQRLLSSVHEWCDHALAEQQDLYAAPLRRGNLLPLPAADASKGRPVAACRLLPANGRPAAVCRLLPAADARPF